MCYKYTAVHLNFQIEAILLTDKLVKELGI